MQNETVKKPLIGSDNNALIALLSINLVVRFNRIFKSGVLFK